MTAAFTIADAVDSLVSTFGTGMVLERPTGRVYDPQTGTMSYGPVESFHITGVLLNYKDSEVDGTVVRAGDVKLIVPARGDGCAPQIGDRVNGFEIVDVRSFQPNGIVVAWACQMRR